ncbi:hypothetical protein, partial [Microcella alkalica]|uniref:hypothetical protein n=1 Tax=Microcella alkalica TaxID=355930 RepID=UPI001B7CF9A3
PIIGADVSNRHRHLSIGPFSPRAVRRSAVLVSHPILTHREELIVHAHAPFSVTAFQNCFLSDGCFIGQGRMSRQSVHRRMTPRDRDAARAIGGTREAIGRVS